MKTLRLTTAIAMALALTSAPAMADVKKNQEAKPDDWNKSIALQPLNTQQKSSYAGFSKDNQLRCWQNGELIVLENDWKAVDPSKGRLLSNGSKKLHAFDYGETFCIYLGG